MRTNRITAAGDHLTLSLSAEAVTASATSRTLSGVVVKFGVPGNTSRGKLKVAPGALTFPDDLGTVKLTKEHDRADSRGHLSALDVNGERIRASLKVADGPEGDAALREATDRTRDGLSFDVIDATIVGDTITSGRVVAIGQVGIPAYSDGRIDAIAAASTNGETMLTDAQIARLAELRSQTTLTDAESAELSALAVLAGDTQTPAPPAPSSDAAASPAAPAQVAASMPAIPPTAAETTSSTTTAPRTPGAALSQMVAQVTAGLAARAGGDVAGIQTITAALADITNTAHSSVIEPPAWSGELWSGLVYEPLFLDLFTSGDLTSFEGKGWRFTSKLAIADYAGDKAEIPTSNVTTESSNYEAARMAVGVDIDRKFFDFPNTGFVESLFAQVRESWTMQLDTKVAAYIAANKVAARDVEGVGGVDLAAFPTLLKAAAAAVRALRRRKVGKASFVLVNDDDLFSLFDVASKDVPVFLDLFDIDPSNFRAAPEALVPAGTVLAGVKQAATVRTLPGSPIRVEAQNLTRAGIDEAFFGYWAIEEHHTSGIASATFTPA